jgi:hypothetical protein
LGFGPGLRAMHTCMRKAGGQQNANQYETGTQRDGSAHESGDLHASVGSNALQCRTHLREKVLTLTTTVLFQKPTRLKHL